MRYGGKESGGDQLTGLMKRRLLEGEEFSRYAARIAVSKICQSTGFHSSQQSASSAFADITIRYICRLGKTAIFYANLSGRTSCSVFDVILGLEDFGLLRGYPGASDVHRCLLSSGIIRELMQFVNTEVDASVRRPIMKFPIPRMPKPNPSFAQVREVPAGNHIPDWLPRFPDPNTYRPTQVWKKRDTDAKEEKVEKTRQRRKAERSLLSIQSKLGFNAPAEIQLTFDGDVEKGSKLVASNPFLALPLSCNDKEISEVVIPRELEPGKSSALLETFAPASEASKVESLDLDSNDKIALPQRRTTIQFKIRVGKKFTEISPSSHILDARKNSWFLMDDEKDDKKKRAEIIT
ncbi:transcription initiation factor TFIID subunit 8-like isoform X2 [Zingiber officinale]|uniref:transcription initiation factor TFIID subunit 8-like isoform X2 n=1 Tax=Zingiber officinale TaxID=94328 RepID=UPI001C4C597E|nr:transcription initiation factor TFIID subunit 8-like isoform X2 [Zingiber officinale]